MNVEQIKELTAILESSKLKKIVVKSGDFELQLEKEGDVSPAAHLPPPYYPPRMEPQPHYSEPAKAALPKGASPQGAQEPSGTFVTSPMVGTFYSSPSPGQPSFVKVGDSVEENTVVCIIEAMKVLNEVKAGKKGKIAEILIENTQPVEFGSKMFRIE